jgi:hypothetical protein
MRIACVYLPSFPLQAHLRQAPHLIGAPVVVADSGLQGSIVMACSRAAWEEGIRPGMATATARAIVPALHVLAADPDLYERALAAVIDGAMGLSEAVDIGTPAERTGPHRALYLRVPARMRGDSFGQRMLAQLARQGFRGRVGVADDRFTAYVAAVTVERQGGRTRLDDEQARSPVFHQSCTTVPRGGSAAFLAPLPLGYLPIDPDVQGMLQTCGVRTLGDFAALPPPSVSRAWSDVDFRALARGQGPARVRGVARTALLERTVIESQTLQHPAPEGEDAGGAEGEGGAGMASLAGDGAAGDAGVGGEHVDSNLRSDLGLGALRTLCDRIGYRLDGRARVAVRLAARLRGPGGEIAAFDVVPRRPTASGRELLETILAQAEGLSGTTWIGIDLAVTQERDSQVSELALFGIPEAEEAPAMAVAMQVQEELTSRHELHVGARFASTTPRLVHRSPSPSRARTRRRTHLQQQLF